MPSSRRPGETRRWWGLTVGRTPEKRNKQNQHPQLGFLGLLLGLWAPYFTCFILESHPIPARFISKVEALLDHLLEHPNVPSFVALRLIQRFVTSNPSKSYVTHVADAFRSGAYQGVQYGRYGDLKAREDGGERGWGRFEG